MTQYNYITKTLENCKSHTFLSFHCLLDTKHKFRQAMTNSSTTYVYNRQQTVKPSDTVHVQSHNAVSQSVIEIISA